MQTYYPEIEDNIPLPKGPVDAMPELSPEDVLQMRARTIKLLSDLAEEPIVPTEENETQARELAKEMIQNPGKPVDFAKYPNETIAYLAGMVAQTNHMIVNELSDLKLYVVNKLVMEIESAKDSKSRISALAKLGEIDGVDAFKKRSEVTVQIKPIEEVEKELLTLLEGVEYTVVDENADAIDAASTPEA